METRIPPPVVGLACGLLMWLVRGLAPAPAIGLAPRATVAVLVALAGLGVAAAGVRAVRAAGTTLNPLHPDEASALVTNGIYTRTRNPMYLGMLMLLLGWTAFLASPLALAGPALFVGWMNRFQIAPEERALGRLFGDAYAAYCRRTRRWV